MNPTSSSSIVEPPRQNPSSSLYDDHPSKGSPIIKNKDFSFHVHPAVKLKQELACLSDPHFNPQGLGVMEVTEIGLEITCNNTSKSGAVAHLWLKSTGLIDFQCNNPTFFCKLVNLNHIFQNLVHADDEDTVTIHHLHASTQLFFSFGNDPPTQFSEELFEVDGANYEKFPNITYACEAVILCEHFKQMIQVYEAAMHKLVTADISMRNLKVFVGDMEWWYHFKRGDKVDGIRGMVGGEKHHAWFQWPDCEFLKKAALVAPGLLLCFVTDPPNCIMLRFNLRELGDLVYLHKSELTLLNSHLCHELKGGLRPY